MKVGSVFRKYWKLLSKTKNDLSTVSMPLQFESNEKLGAKLELVTFRCLGLSQSNFSVKLSGST